MGTGQQALNMLRSMGVPDDRLVDFPSWIDLDRYPPRKRFQEPVDRPIRFISAGRVENSVKGHDLAVEALAHASSVSRQTFEYVIAGDGPDAGRVRNLAMKLGIGDHVTILGWLEPPALVNAMLGADLLIHPSPVHEPFGVAVIEAMAAGLGVLASDVTCAALDRVVRGVTGFIHRAGDVRELSDQILDTLENREKIGAMGAAARREAEAWPIDRGVEDIRRVLNIRAG
jgi:glycosyltransferase involved in cell wall biosynthesis